jgi:hypothetical protein
LVAKFGANARGLDEVELQMRSIMKDDCARWLNRFETSERVEAAGRFLTVVRGQERVDPVKGLYDAGLVARFDETQLVRPVSSVAASVVLEVLTKEYRKKDRVPLSGLIGAARGLELERRLIASLYTQTSVLLPATTLDGQPTGGLLFPTDFALVFTAISDIVAYPTSNVLYMPSSSNYPCDAIFVASRGNDKPPHAYVLEASITDPRTSTRLEKCVGWFGTGKLIDELRQRFPNCDVSCVLFWDGNIEASKHDAYKRLLLVAQTASVSISVVDCVGLRLLGISA